MKAIQIRNLGEPSVLQIAEVPDPKPAEGQVVVEVKAAGVNYADILMRKGHYGTKLPLPFVPGFEAAGVLLETGAGVSDWKPGDRVMGTVLREMCGCYSEKAVMLPWLLMPIPDELSFEEAAAFPEAFVTAWLALRVFGRLAEGETVLIHAAGGGVGSAAVQLATEIGARVFGTAGSDDKLRKVRALGADVVINYVAQDFVEEVKKNTDGHGVDLVMDGVGGDVFEKSIKCLQPLGRLVAFGSASGKASSVPVPALMQGSIAVSGFSFGRLSVVRRDLIRDCMRTVLEYLTQGKVRPIVGHTFPLAEALAAHELITSRGSFGKVVLVL